MLKIFQSAKHEGGRICKNEGKQGKSICQTTYRKREKISALELIEKSAKTRSNFSKMWKFQQH